MYKYCESLGVKGEGSKFAHWTPADSMSFQVR